MDHAPSIPDGNLSRRKLLSERCQTTSRCTIDGGRPFHAALTFDDTLKDDVGIVQGASAKSLLRSIRTQGKCVNDLTSQRLNFELTRDMLRGRR